MLAKKFAENSNMRLANIAKNYVSTRKKFELQNLIATE